MRQTALIGVILIVLGVVALTYQGVTYTEKEKIIDIGPIQASQETQNMIPFPPILGGLALAGGVVLLLVGKRD